MRVLSLRMRWRAGPRRASSDAEAERPRICQRDGRASRCASVAQPQLRPSFPPLDQRRPSLHLWSGSLPCAPLRGVRRGVAERHGAVRPTLVRARIDTSRPIAERPSHAGRIHDERETAAFLVLPCPGERAASRSRSTHRGDSAALPRSAAVNEMNRSFTPWSTSASNLAVTSNDRLRCARSAYARGFAKSAWEIPKFGALRHTSSSPPRTFDRFNRLPRSNSPGALGS